MSISFAIVMAIGILVSFFLFWRRLKEDYSGNIVFTTCFYVLFGLLIGEKLIDYLWQGWWFWGGILGSVVGYFLAVFRFKLNFFETIEALGLALINFLAFFFLADSIVKASITSLVGSLVLFSLVFLFFFFESKYKNLTWYRSGRLGFSGFTTIGVFFLIRAFVASIFPDMLSFTRSISLIDAIFSTIASFGFLGAVYYLAINKR